MVVCKPNLVKRFDPMLHLWTCVLCLCQGQAFQYGKQNVYNCTKKNYLIPKFNNTMVNAVASKVSNIIIYNHLEIIDAF